MCDKWFAFDIFIVIVVVFVVVAHINFLYQVKYVKDTTKISYYHKK